MQVWVVFSTLERAGFLKLEEHACTLWPILNDSGDAGIDYHGKYMVNRRSGVEGRTTIEILNNSRILILALAGVMFRTLPLRSVFENFPGGVEDIVIQPLPCGGLGHCIFPMVSVFFVLLTRLPSTEICIIITICRVAICRTAVVLTRAYITVLPYIHGEESNYEILSEGRNLLVDVISNCRITPKIIFSMYVL